MSCSSLADWKRLTLEANQLFELGEHGRAVAVYERAQGVALAGFGHWGEADDAMAAVVVSYLNLAEAQARSGELRQAAISLCTLHGGLQQARGNTALAPGLRESAAQHLKESFASLVRFQAAYGPSPEVARWLSPCRCGHCGGERALQAGQADSFENALADTLFGAAPPDAVPHRTLH